MLLLHWFSASTQSQFFSFSTACILQIPTQCILGFRRSYILELFVDTHLIQSLLQVSTVHCLQYFMWWMILSFSDLGFDLVSCNSLSVLIQLRHQTNYILKINHVKFEVLTVQSEKVPCIYTEEWGNKYLRNAGRYDLRPARVKSQPRKSKYWSKCLQWSFLMSQYGTRSDDWISNFCCTIYEACPVSKDTKRVGR